MAIVIEMFESGSDVVVTLDGSVDLTDLVYSGPQLLAPAGIFSGDNIRFAPGDGVIEYDRWNAINGVSTGKFGSNSSNLFTGSFTTTDYIAFINLSASDGFIQVPSTYVSGTLLSNSMTFIGQSLTTLGLTTGTYVYSWGTTNPDSVTIYVGTTPTTTTTTEAPTTTTTTESPTTTMSTESPRDANVEYVDCNVNCSGSTETITPPHPVYTDGFGTAVTQMNAVVIGGNGLNS